LPQIGPAAALRRREDGEQHTGERMDEHRRRGERARERQRRPGAARENEQRQKREADGEVLREEARVERSVQSQVRRPDHVWGPEETEQDRNREPRCPAAREPAGIEEDRVQREREDREAYEGQKPSKRDGPLIGSAEKAPEERDPLHVRGGVLRGDVAP